MNLLSNVGAQRLGNALARSLDKGSRLSIISTYFTVFAYRELRGELGEIDSVRFLFSEPTFIKTMEDEKDPRQFELERRDRERGVGGVGLEHLRWGNFDLIVIDESHNFRNKSTDSDKKDRYTRLIEDVIKSGRRTKVLMLSATPVNNRLLDLRNQIELITEGDDAYLAETDGIPSITQVTRVAQQRFNEWSKLPDEERTTESFAEAVNPNYFKLLDVLTIARSRQHITKYYGAESSTFPTRRPPHSFKTPKEKRHRRSETRRRPHAQRNSKAAHGAAKD